MVINGVRFAAGAEVMIDPKDFRPHLYDKIEPPAPKTTPPAELEPESAAEDTSEESTDEKGTKHGSAK